MTLFQKSDPFGLNFFSRMNFMGTTWFFSCLQHIPGGSQPWSRYFFEATKWRKNQHGKKPYVCICHWCHRTSNYFSSSNLYTYKTVLIIYKKVHGLNAILCISWLFLIKSVSSNSRLIVYFSKKLKIWVLSKHVGT